MSETPEQAATRRRWISLAEAVAVAGVLIAAISLYLTWSDKREERAEKAAATQTETKAASVITLRATVAKGGERLDLADAAHPVDGVDIAFPGVLGMSGQTGLVKPVIDTEVGIDDIAVALERMEGRKVFGKIVLRMDREALFAAA